MILVLVLVAAAYGWALLRRHRRKDTLAGLQADRPTFNATPPERSLIRRDDMRW